MKVQFGCECQDCNMMSECTKSCAPVIKLVERNGKRIKVCSRCDLSSDKLIKLLFNKNTDARPFMDYDSLGAIYMTTLLNQNLARGKRKEVLRNNGNTRKFIRYRNRHN